jgi:hypothetical protein
LCALILEMIRRKPSESFMFSKTTDRAQ